MHKLIFYIILFSTVALASQASYGARPELLCDPFIPGKDCPRMEVSIIELIANPSRFNKKPVRVLGYLDIEFEGEALYLHEEDYKHRLTRNGLSLLASDNFRGILKIVRTSPM